MPFSREHVPWSERSHREKVIIIMFYGLMLLLIVNIVGWIAFICVFLNNEKYVRRVVSDVRTLAKASVP